MSEDVAIRIEITGLELDPLEEGPGEGIRLVVTSGYTGESLTTLLLTFSMSAITRALEFIRLKQKGAAAAEVIVEHKKTKIQIKGYSQQDAVELFEQIQTLINPTTRTHD